MRDRVTRGHSDLQKQEEASSSESQSSEKQSNNPPKQKKIHHMTLKAMERRQKLMESGELKSQSKSQNVQKIPKKRGRPKGFKVKKVQQKQDYEIQEVIQELSQISQKKQIVLRKRDPSKKMVDEDSQLLQKQLQEIEEEPIQIKPLQIKKPQIQVQISAQVSQDVPIPHVPKKRGRKKKIIVESLPLPPPPITVSTQKLFTIPKAQTYDNYLKYYDSIMQKKQEDNQLEFPLIFDKFLDGQGYDRLLKSIK